MAEEKKFVELTNEALLDADISGGGTGIRIFNVSYDMTTGLTKKCSLFKKGPNDWPVTAVRGTCAECGYFRIVKGYHVCGHPERVNKD